MDNGIAWLILALVLVSLSVGGTNCHTALRFGYYIDGQKHVVSFQEKP